MASQKATTWRLKQSQGNNKLSPKVMPFSYHKEQKHLLKEAVPITYTLEKRLFAAATFKGLWVISFQRK